MTTPIVKRIELVWPNKGQVPTQDSSGRWSQESPPEAVSFRGLRSIKRIPSIDDQARSIAITGSRLDSLGTLRRIVTRAVQLVYADIPRLEGFDESRSFQGATGQTVTTWLSVIREHVRSVRGLLTRDGVFVAQAGDLEAPFIRLLLAELFGRENYIGTALWQSHYGPKAGKPSNEIDSIHENIICFAFDRESIARIAVPVVPEGYSNPDSDPRGEWEAGQKDAGRDTVKMTYNVPPYRWTVVKGRLPKGLWRLSPMSGVIWGTPTEAGTFRFTVRAEDSAGKTSEQQVSLKVGKAGEVDLPKSVWWMSTPPKGTRSAPTVTTEKLHAARVGEKYCAVLVAAGGSPFVGNPRPGRGWAFGQSTLEKAVLEDRCWFGKKGSSIPEPKKYLEDLEGGKKYIKVTSWWDDVAYTQDSTKHQNALHHAGLIELPFPTAKPELLLARIVEAFTAEGSLVLELFSRAGDLASVALKLGRDFIALLGASDLEQESATKCAVPRLQAIVTGTELEKLPPPEEKKRPEYLRLPARGGFRLMEVGPVVATKLPSEEYPRLAVEELGSGPELMRAILTSEGFFIAEGHDEHINGVSWDQLRRAVILAPQKFIDQVSAAEFASSVEAGTFLTVYYFRCTEDFEPRQSHGGVTFRRVPSELAT